MDTVQERFESWAEVALSEESLRMINELVEHGIYGRTSSEIVARFVDQALQNLTEQPVFTFPVE